MTISMMDRMTEEQQFLINQAMEHMDAYYDESMSMLRNCEDGDLERHSTRGSAHYAVGLLIRRQSGDLERACKVLAKVMDMQFDCPEEIYHGTFRTSPQAENPPAGNYPWKSFAPGFAYFLSDTVGKITAQFMQQLEREMPHMTIADRREAGRALEAAADQVLPPVWKSYDPNWREFIACAFAVILEHFEAELPKELVARMDESMGKAVQGSIDRRLSDAIPMNTNIELMHIFVSHYFGCRLHNEEWIKHADREADAFLQAYKEFGTFAEFNSSTYYGVDLTVLGLIRTYGRSETVKRAMREVEQGLWENIALFYNANLENLCGPFSRAYEMEMRAHSSIGVFIYLALGRGCEHLAGINCESGHDPLIALVGVDVPETVKPALAAFQEGRYVEKQFRELCERDKPGSNSNLCTAAAWIESKRMLGAMSGSRNTNGQLHPATIHWMTDDGAKYYLRLIRREAGGNWNSHLRGIVFDGKVAKDCLSVDVDLSTEQDIDVYFEITGPGSNGSQVLILPDEWRLPGLTCSVTADAPRPVITATDDRIEIVYPYRPVQGTAGSRMSFKLELLS
ncbi:hypothetical protein AB6A23_22690 [Paenibacillus tarimensis]